jgi:hypothetical protein
MSIPLHLGYKLHAMPASSSQSPTQNSLYQPDPPQSHQHPNDHPPHPYPNPSPSITRQPLCNTTRRPSLSPRPRTTSKTTRRPTFIPTRTTPLHLAPLSTTQEPPTRTTPHGSALRHATTNRHNNRHPIPIHNRRHLPPLGRTRRRGAVPPRLAAAASCAGEAGVEACWAVRLGTRTITRICGVGVVGAEGGGGRAEGGACSASAS